MSKRTWNKKYTKKKSSSQIIDEKIALLDREMRKTKLGESIANSTSGLYTVTGFDSGEPEIPPVPAVPPTYENVTGGLSNANDFVWPNQGDGSNPNAAPVIPDNLYTTYNGQQVPALRQIEGDYGNDIPLGYVVGNSILSTYPVGYLAGDGPHFIASAGVFANADTELGRKYQAAFNNWPYPGKIDKTIYFWGPLDCFLGDCRGAGQYYPSNLSNTSTPKADYALYAYTLWLPADAQGNPLPNRIMTDPGAPEIPAVPAVPPKPVVLSRFGLGDPNFFPGFIDILEKGVQSISDAISSTIEDISQVVEPIIDALGSTATSVVNTLTDLTSGFSDGLNLLNDVKQTISSAYQNGDVIPPANPGERPTISEGAPGSQSNPIQTNLSSSTINYFSSSLNNYNASVDPPLQQYTNTLTQASPLSGGNLGAKGTHNTVTGKPYVDSSGNLHIPDTYGFGPSEHIRGGYGGLVGAIADTAETVVNALGGDGKGASESVQTFFDQLGPLGAVASELAGGGSSDPLSDPIGAATSPRGSLPGKDAPIVHFETVIPASNIPNANFNTSTVKESNLFEKFKRKQELEKKDKGISGMQALVKTLESLPKPIKKVLLFQIMTELEIAFLSPDQKVYREKEIRNKLLVKTSELYVDTHFPENQKLFKKLQQSIKRNIKLTDPKTFKNVADTPSFKKLLSVDYVNENKPKKKLKLQNRNKKTAARFLKKPRVKSPMELIDEKIIQLEKDLKKTGMTP